MRVALLALVAGPAVAAHVQPFTHNSVPALHWHSNSERRTSVVALAKAKAKKPKKTAKVAAPKAAKGFGAAKPEQLPPPVQALVRQGKALAKSCADGSEKAKDPRAWFQIAAGAADLEEYAEARVIMEAGVQHCGEEGELLVQALGQMRRQGPTPEVEEAGGLVDWPGKGDDSPYDVDSMEFMRLSSRAWPDDCPRGTTYPSGDGAIAVSVTPVLDPAECGWVVDQADRTAQERWLSDHADASNIGADKIWAKGFPDRLWLREVPGLVEWFEHRLRTRLFPMLQSCYPEAIPTADVLRCHDAFISRYDSDGMNSLEVHQDTTDFTFTIALNPSADYEGGGTLFPNVKPADAPPTEPFGNVVAAPDVGCVAAFPGRLHHGGNAITSGVRYIIPLFIYLDRNKLTDKPRGYILDATGLPPGEPAGLDVFSPHLVRK